MSASEIASDVIEQMKIELGVEMDRDLASALGVNPSTVAAWRRRNNVPAKYQLRFRRVSDEKMDDGRPTSSGRLRNAYIFCLMEIVSKKLDSSDLYIAPSDWHDLWRGFRLSDAYAYFSDMVPAVNDRDELRSSFEALKKEIQADDFYLWLETMGEAG